MVKVKIGIILICSLLSIYAESSADDSTSLKATSIFDVKAMEPKIGFKDETPVVGTGSPGGVVIKCARDTVLRSYLGSIDPKIDTYTFCTKAGMTYQ